MDKEKDSIVNEARVTLYLESKVRRDLLVRKQVEEERLEMDRVMKRDLFIMIVFIILTTLIIISFR